MRTILIPLLLFLGGLLAPPLLERVMSGVPVWVLRMAACALCAGGVAAFLGSESIYPKVKFHIWTLAPTIVLVVVGIVWLFVFTDLILKEGVKLTFEDDSPYVEDGYGGTGKIYYQNRRVKITCSDPGRPRLRVPNVTLNGINRRDVYLQKWKPEQPDDFHAGQEGYWNVAQLVSTEPQTIKLLRMGHFPRHLGNRGRFQLIASIEKHETRKWVEVEIDDKGKLLFRVT